MVAMSPRNNRPQSVALDPERVGSRNQQAELGLDSYVRIHRFVSLGIHKAIIETLCQHLTTLIFHGLHGG